MERVLLASRCTGTAEELHDSLQELAELVRAAGGEVVGTVVQEKPGCDPSTYLGAGKVAEIAARLAEAPVDLVVFDQELKPTQNRNLEEAWQVKVLDRTGLILDIFARRASSREGKLQVELAQLQYLYPRIMGQWYGLSRLAGGIGTRGPGEAKLEIDRRRVRERMTRIRHELEKVQMQRDIHREKRERVPIPIVSLVGYTNAGKSTLMNTLTHAGVLVEDKLFATLDPTVRRLKLPSGRQCLLTDTVGFVRKLPHPLVEAFKATFREIDSAELLLHVIDTPQPHVAAQVETVDQVLAELGLAHKVILRVFNKMDLKPTIPVCLTAGHAARAISAQTGLGLPELLSWIDEQLARDYQRVRLHFPYHKGGAIAQLFRACRVLAEHHDAQGTTLIAELDTKFIGKYASFIAR